MRDVSPVGGQGDIYVTDIYPTQRARLLGMDEVQHRTKCRRSPCRCFGFVTELRDADGVLEVRLLDVDETVAIARLAAGDTLTVTSSVVMRAARTGDWCVHYPVVSELLLREVARFADQRRTALAVPESWPEPLLAELGFALHGDMMLRPARTRARR